MDLLPSEIDKMRERGEEGKNVRGEIGKNEGGFGIGKRIARTREMEADHREKLTLQTNNGGVKDARVGQGMVKVGMSGNKTSRGIKQRGLRIVRRRGVAASLRSKNGQGCSRGAKLATGGGKPVHEIRSPLQKGNNLGYIVLVCRQRNGMGRSAQKQAAGWVLDEQCTTMSMRQSLTEFVKQKLEPG